MIYIIESQEDVYKLANWYNQDRISAEDYWAAIDRWAKTQVENEVRQSANKILRSYKQV